MEALFYWDQRDAFQIPLFLSYTSGDENRNIQVFLLIFSLCLFPKHTENSIYILLKFSLLFINMFACNHIQAKTEIYCKIFIQSIHLKGSNLMNKAISSPNFWLNNNFEESAFTLNVIFNRSKSWYNSDLKPLNCMQIICFKNSYLKL